MHDPTNLSNKMVCCLAHMTCENVPVHSLFVHTTFFSVVQAFQHSRYPRIKTSKLQNASLHYIICITMLFVAENRLEDIDRHGVSKQAYTLLSITIFSISYCLIYYCLFAHYLLVTRAWAQVWNGLIRWNQRKVLAFCPPWDLNVHFSRSCSVTSGMEPYSALLSFPTIV